MKSAIALCLGVALAGTSTLSHAEAPHNIEGVVSVSIQQAKKLFDTGAVFVDVRDHHSWSTGHIDGAVNLDLESDEFSVLYVSESLDRKTPIVFYSSSPLNVNSAVASYMARQWGYNNVYYFRDGYYAWISEDFPVELRLAGRRGHGNQQDLVVTR